MPSALRVLSKPSPSVVTQEELNHWFAIQNNIRRLKALQERLERDLLERLLSGAECEPGAHSAIIRKSFHGARRVVRLEIV